MGIPFRMRTVSHLYISRQFFRLHLLSTIHKDRLMKKLTVLILLLLICSIPALADHRIGGGVNYWVALDDIHVDDIEKDGLSYLASYQYRATLLGLQVDVEFLPDLFGENAIAPAAYLLVGEAIYGAAGIGIVHVEDGWAHDPFFALKAGLDLEVLPSIYLDISGSYRFNSQIDLGDAVGEIDFDNVYLGAAVRVGF